MKKLSKLLCGGFAAMFTPMLANAAGTYYTGNYQSPQTRYSQQAYNNAQRMKNSAYSQQGLSAYSRGQYTNAGYTTKTNAYQRTNTQQTKNKQIEKSVVAKNGFTLGAGFSRQTSMWQFEMKSSDSILHYDNVDWNVFDVNAGYVFGAGNTQVQIAGGFQYGMQSGESTMVDDDITNGGYPITELTDDAGTIYQQIGHALSIGTSKDGSMMGFNGGLGLKDFMKWGGLKVTPSVGWRYLKYDLETHNNHGLALETLEGGYGCYGIDGSDEIQCDPLFIWYTLNSAGEVDPESLIYVTRDENGYIQVPAGLLDMGGNYYYAQPGISHKYEVEWSGPYFALDMLYDINPNNSVDAHVELGLPSYTATGDQPYRFDWAHPKSVEDSTGIGGAFHLGLGANWKTALSDKVSLTIGVTYDYYTVGDADAKTHLNESYYMGIYNDILAEYLAAGLTEADMLSETLGNDTAISIAQIEQECPGWVCTIDGEVEAFYKSLGVRVGLNAKF